VTGYQDDDTGGHVPADRRVRTTPSESDSWPVEESRDGEYRYWREETEEGPFDQDSESDHSVEILDDGHGGTGYSLDGAPAGAPPAEVARRGGRTATRRRRHPYVRQHRILAAFALFVVVVLIVGAIGVVYARRQINPGGRLGAVVTVKVPKGSSTSEIGTILAQAGVIHAARLFPVYAKLTNSSGLLPGTYHLARNESYSRVIDILQKGPPLIIDKLTIPEGFTLAQIAARLSALPGLHLSAAKFLAAGTSGRVRSQFEPPGVNNLEGLVFPATYEIRQGQEEADILQELVNTFEERVDALGLVDDAARLHYTPYQVVTVASIIEREAKLAEDRPYVSSVLYNRLARNIPLGADSTQTYYLRLTHPDLLPTVAELNAPSPYNTRLLHGLPPTPIANPGIPSLEAAMDPIRSSYLYFVEINPDGKLGFATDGAGFLKLQEECRSANLC